MGYKLTPGSTNDSLLYHHLLPHQIMKFTAIVALASAALVAAAPAPAPEANAVADFLAGGSFDWGAAINGLFPWNWSFHFSKTITVLYDSSNQPHYFNFPDGYKPCGCASDNAYAVAESSAQFLVNNQGFTFSDNFDVKFGG